MDAAHGDPPRAGGAILDDGPRRRWQKTGAAIGVSVNISARNLTAENLPELVCAAIDRAWIPAACLELESTESALMGDLERAQQRLGELRALGLRLAIDDFGTGMSSLSYLRDLPVQGLKTDRGLHRRHAWHRHRHLDRASRRGPRKGVSVSRRSGRGGRPGST